MMPPRLQLSGVSRTFTGPPEAVVLRDVSLSVDQGEFIAIEGPSGGGKSTLLNLLGLLDRPSTGTVMFGGRSVERMSDRDLSRIRSGAFGFIFQAFHLLDRRRTVDSVELGLVYRGMPPRERRVLALQALDRVGLLDHAYQHSNTLSGGQRQRVAIARALASGSPVVVADEPTGNLDSENSRAVIECLLELNAQGTTVIVVTHATDVAAVASRRMTMRDGRIEEPPAAIIVGEHRRRDEVLPVARGVPSSVRVADVIRDAGASLRSRIGRTGALVAAVGLGVGLAVATVGVTGSSSAQVSEVFDMSRNRDVTVSWTEPGRSDHVGEGMAQIGNRLEELPGVESAGILTTFTGVSVQPNPLRDRLRPPGFSMSGDVEAAARLGIEWAPNHSGGLVDGEVLVGASLADQLNLGPIPLRPTVVIGAELATVVGTIEESPRLPQLLGSIVMTRDDLDRVGDPTRFDVLIRTRAGAAQQIAKSAPLVIDPYNSSSLLVDSPPDPVTLRAEIEASVRTSMAIVSIVAIAGAIGALANAMALAVAARRSEIGLRRALGARPHHVFSLLLTESAMIGLVGGVVGITVGLLSVLGVTIVNGWVPVFDLGLVPLALGGGVVVGVLGGTLAAARAMRVNPADALRA